MCIRDRAASGLARAIANKAPDVVQPRRRRSPMVIVAIVALGVVAMAVVRMRRDRAVVALPTAHSNDSAAMIPALDATVMG